ncbi:MAG TPA: glycosyltransferase family 2 protein [Stellaceae bacterium]|nr:glycosyltransferase family 2 protein [Stellaceae bacterium]
MRLERITPLIITHNEACNIARTLAPLAWAQRVVIIDSGSTDGTRDIASAFPQVEVISHPFVDFASQCDFGLHQIRTEWVLSLDADYRMSEAVIDELRALDPADDVGGYSARFVYCIHGRPLRGSLYPPRTVLYRTKGAGHRQEGHAHRVAVPGRVLRLRGVVYHDDRKPLMRWLASQQRYAREEAAYLLGRRRQLLRMRDRLRLMAWPAPFAALFYALFLKRVVLDGRAGWFYALQRLLAETLLALELIEQRSTAIGALGDR